MIHLLLNLLLSITLTKILKNVRSLVMINLLLPHSKIFFIYTLFILLILLTPVLNLIISLNHVGLSSFHLFLNLILTSVPLATDPIHLNPQSVNLWNASYLPSYRILFSITTFLCLNS